jgi:hypothetical protein
MYLVKYSEQYNESYDADEYLTEEFITVVQNLTQKMIFPTQQVFTGRLN